MRVLVVEDSPELLRPLVTGLTRSGYNVEQATDGVTALWYARGKPFDLIVLDIMLPRLDGLSVLDTLRQESIDSRVLLLTAKDTVADRVVGLRSGADDYLVKPFAFDELLARIEALLRRSIRPMVGTIAIGELHIDLAAKTVSQNGKPIALTPREYSIVDHLVRHRGQVVSRADIERHVYDEHAELMSNVVDSAVCSIRRKLDPSGDTPLIVTRRGLGYIIPG